MIEIRNLTKRYGSNAAIDNLNFTVSDGEILGFLGPNGAGKTTTMNIMTGYISPTEGTVLINGHDILDEPLEAKKNIGHLPDIPPLYGNMFVLEYLKFVCEIKGLKKEERKKHIEDIIVQVKISDVKNRIIKNLSKGYRQRVGLAQAMIGNPAVIILDEPTSGLDPKQIIEMREVIKSLQKNHTVILSSHILSEVASVCTRVMIINKGKIVTSGNVDKLTESLNSSNKIMVRLKAEPEKVKSILNKCLFVKVLEFMDKKEDGCCDLIVTGEKDIDIRENLFFVMSENKIPILVMKPVDLSLEEIFIKITADASKNGMNLEGDILNIENLSEEAMNKEDEEIDGDH